MNHKHNDDSVATSTSTSTIKQRQQQQQHQPSYIALHARVELEIMSHTCGSSMEKNLTKIIEMVYDYFIVQRHQRRRRRRQQQQQQQELYLNEPLLSGLFIAVSRDGMEVQGNQLYEKHKIYADENLRTLNILTSKDNTIKSQSNDDNEYYATSNNIIINNNSNSNINDNLFDGKEDDHHNHQFFKTIKEELPVFECGKSMLTDYYDSYKHLQMSTRSKNDGTKINESSNSDSRSLSGLDHGSLLQSVLNFYIAVQADIFVGVRGSSYSTDVMMTRYHLGKGTGNYRYTGTDGIVPVESDGLPEPHTNCNRDTTNKNARKIIMSNNMNRKRK